MAERQIPGGQFVNETAVAERQIPGGPFVDEATSTGAFTFAADRGTFSLTGNAVAFDYSGDSAALDAETSTPFVLTGVAAGLSHGYQIAAAAGVFAFSGAPSLSDFSLTAERATFTLSGNRIGTVMQAARAQFALASPGAALIYSGEAALSPSDRSNPALKRKRMKRMRG